MYYVYILANQNNKVIYVGITNDLRRRFLEHKNELVDGFTKKYHVHKLVFYECFMEPQTAIAREKQLKKWIRSKKNNLIESLNPTWEDLSLVLFPEVASQ